MEREAGCRNSPTWLIGDSPPKNWADDLSVPFDSRHPARHNVWTPIVDGIQERVYRDRRRRFDDSRLYVRNAVPDYTCKEAVRGRNWYGLEDETEAFGKLLNKHAPPIVFTFGAFVFEFVRRSRGCDEERAYSYWSTKRLGEQFRLSLKRFDPDKVNVIPLLHVSIARGKFLVSHKYFTCAEDGNYFDYVADEVSALLMEKMSKRDIWVSHSRREFQDS